MWRRTYSVPHEDRGGARQGTQSRWMLARGEFTLNTLPGQSQRPDTRKARISRTQRSGVRSTSTGDIVYVLTSTNPGSQGPPSPPNRAKKFCPDPAIHMTIRSMEKMRPPNQGVDQAPPIPPNSSPTILDLASRFFNSAPNEELFASIRDASTSKLEEFLDAYRQFASHGQLQAPPLDRSTLRPYLSTDPSGNTAAWLRGAFDMGLWELSEEDAVWKIVDEIKHRLLYCHSIAVDDPFGRIILLATTQGLHPTDIDRHKRQLLNFVNLLIHLRPLIERHVLCFVSDEAYLKGDAKRATPFWKLFDEFTRNTTLVPPIDIMEFSARAPRDVVDLWEQHLAGPVGQDLICDVLKNAAQERISHAFKLGGSLGDRTCPYLPFKYDVQLHPPEVRGATLNHYVALLN
jgi:hypothetical protein